VNLTQTINTAATTTALTSSVNPSAFGQPVTFTAKVTTAFGPVPSGTVSFVRGSASIGTGTLNSSGIATITTNSVPTGTHTITAIYSGYSGYASSSANLPDTVNTAATTTALSSSVDPSTSGQSVTFTAKVASPYGPATSGTVSFVRGASSIGNSTLNSSGIASVSTTTLPAGTHTITAIYSGYAGYSSSSVNLVQTIN
jgi:hypothetical protein